MSVEHINKLLYRLKVPELIDAYKKRDYDKLIDLIDLRIRDLENLKADISIESLIYNKEEDYYEEEP